MDNIYTYVIRYNPDNIFTIHLQHQLIGITYENAPVLESNTMEQILKEYAEDIRINPRRTMISFRNKRTGQETSDRNATVADMGLKAGDTLVIWDYSCA